MAKCPFAFTPGSEATAAANMKDIAATKCPYLVENRDKIVHVEKKSDAKEKPGFCPYGFGGAPQWTEGSVHMALDA